MAVTSDFSETVNPSDAIVALALVHALLNRLSENQPAVLRAALDSLRASGDTTIQDARRRLRAMLDQLD
jgi:hypothetical protein